MSANDIQKEENSMTSAELLLVVFDDGGEILNVPCKLITISSDIQSTKSIIGCGIVIYQNMHLEFVCSSKCQLET